MLGELRFKVGSWTELDLAKRLSLLFRGEPEFKPHQKGGGNNSWVLDSTNNWWLLVENGIARITYRYPQGKPAGFFEALAVVIPELTGMKPAETADAK